MKNFALSLAGIIFALIAIVHFVRYNKAWGITFDHFNVPLDWSIYGGVITAVLALIMFIALSRK